ncbi:MAG: hypothetical protein H7Y04_02660 [Verrucomicrobia bacterium]|nr:hypothetical protein [Cytophagales bacterium]
MDNKLEALLEEIYKDGKVSPKEIIEIRRQSERNMVELLAIAGDEGVINALCKSFEVTTQLLQASLLKVRKGEASAEAKQAILNLIDSQMALIKANYEAFK